MSYKITVDYNINNNDKDFYKVVDEENDDKKPTPVPPDDGTERGARTYIPFVPPQHTR